MEIEHSMEILKAYRECKEKQVRGIAEECNPTLCDSCRLLYEQGRCGEHIDAISVAIEALERQSALKPLLEGDGYAGADFVYDIWCCPNCDAHYEVDYDDFKFCPECGQKIDWSEVE